MPNRGEPTAVGFTPSAVLTGASGFLGTALEAALLNEGASVRAISAGPRDLTGRQRTEVLYRGITTALSQQHPEVIFHLAGAGEPYLGEDDAIRQHYANVATTDALIRAIEEYDFRGCVVFASSASVYGNSGTAAVSENATPRPCTRYGVTKLKAEAVLSKRIGSACALRIGRLFHLFGPGQPKLVVFELMRRIIEGEHPLVVKSTGDEIRDFIYVDEAVRALILLGSEAVRAGPPLVVNIASGHGVRIRELALQLLELAERNGEKPVCRPNARPNPISACVGDASRLRGLGLVMSRASSAQLETTLTWAKRYCAA
jgi:nucleoside-diphosphate-sugar epimerase